MTIQSSRPVIRARLRIALVVGLVIGLVMAGGGVATAAWIVAATTTTPVTAGRLTTELTGTDRLSAVNVDTDEYTTPVALTLHNPNPVPVGYTLDLVAGPGALDPAEVELTMWERTGTTCPDAVPVTGTTTGTLAAAPALPVSGAAGESDVAVCAATRFTGDIFSSAGKSLTTTPTLAARMTAGTWTTTSTAAAFTHTVAADLGLATVTNLTCIDQDGGSALANGGIELTWEPVEGASSYRIVSSTGSALEVTATSEFLSTQNVGHATWIDIQAMGPVGESAKVRQTVHVELTENLGETLRCN